MSELILQGVSFGGIFTALLGLSHLMRWRRAMTHRCLVLLSLSVAVLYLYVYFMLRTIYFAPGWLNHAYVPFIYFLGPGLYVFYRSIIEEEYEFRLNRCLFVPGLALLIVFPVADWIWPGAFASRPVDYFMHRRAAPPDVLLLIGFVINGCYYALIFVQSWTLFRLESLRRESAARTLLVILVGTGLVNGICVSAYLSFSLDRLIESLFGVSVLGGVCFIFAQASPHVFSEFAPTARQAYKNSRLAGLNLDSIQARLDQAMKVEEAFLDEELNLVRLAERIQIKPYQLSEYLNAHCGQNFSRYVNGFRVARAAQILSTEDRASILSVAFRVGFNSKTNFNLAFRTIQGLSPRDFVRQARIARAAQAAKTAPRQPRAVKRARS